MTQKPLKRSTQISTTSIPLFALSRQGHQEVVVHGIAFASDSDMGNLADLTIVARSLLKPFQVLAICSESLRKSAGDRLVLAAASHSGQPEHLKALRAFAQDLNVDPDQLRCPACFPMDSGEAERMRATGQAPEPLCHPCAGKHLLMLAGCVEARLPIDNYFSADHPIQKRIMDSVESYAQSTQWSMQWVADSCGVPTAVLPVRALAHLWKRFAQDKTPAAMSLKESWIKFPYLSGGQGRLDSTLTATFPGRLVAKEGADGLLVVQSIEQDDSSTALVKIASGYNSKYLALGLISALKRSRNLSLLFQELAGYLETQLNQYHPQDQLPEFL